MADSLEYRLERLERELAKSNNGVVRGALQAQIDTINKKITAKSGRKATLPDGTTVGVGDTIYETSHPRIYVDYNGKENITTGSIEGKKVTAVSPNGKEIAFNRAYSGRFSYYSTNSYFGNPKSAHAAMVQRAQRDFDSALANIEAAKATAERCGRAISLAQDFDLSKVTVK